MYQDLSKQKHFLFSGNTRIAVASRKGKCRLEKLRMEEFTVGEKNLFDSKEMFIQVLLLANEAN